MRSLSCSQLSVTPCTVACQTPLSMEFSSQEYWSGLPFSSPGDLPDLGVKPESPACRQILLTAELPRNPKDTGVGSVSFLQYTFPTQEFNQCLLHCRRILYQLGYLAGARPNPSLIFAFILFRFPGCLPVLLLLCCLCNGFCLGCKIHLFV